MDGRPLTQRNHFLPLCFLSCFFYKISILEAHGSPCCIWQTACNISFSGCVLSQDITYCVIFATTKEKKGAYCPHKKIRASLSQTTSPILPQHFNMCRLCLWTKNCATTICQTVVASRLSKLK